jgi:hypothetical protein
MPKNDRIAEFSVAGSNAYDALIFGHLQRFKRYPLAARGASGAVMVQFELNRAGEVISSKVTKSSGNQLLDRDSPPCQSVSRLSRRQARHAGQFPRAGQFRALALAFETPGSPVSRPVWRSRSMTTDTRGVAKIPQSGRIPATLGRPPLTPFRQVRETLGNVGKVLFPGPSTLGASRHGVGSVEYQMRFPDRALCDGNPACAVVRPFPPDCLSCDLGS